MLQETSLYVQYAAPLLQNLVFNNLSYDIESFDFDGDVAKVNKAASHLIDSVGYDLGAFRSHGGKMIVSQGKQQCLYLMSSWPRLTLFRLG